MPYQKDGKRQYKRERAWEKENGDQRGKDRAQRNKARREAGLKVGDGKHADHVKPLTEGGSTDKSNVRVTTAKANVEKEARRKKREKK